jgi:hypothetical protein
VLRVTVVASILTLAVGCNKRGADDTVEAPQTTLAGKPRALMLVFGDRAEPRALPLAMLADGQIKPIALDPDGWRNFDKLYFPAGGKLALYRGGASIGEVAVQRGMWDGGLPLYKLPGCKALRPLAALTLPADTTNAAVMLEMLAVSDALPPLARRLAPAKADVDSAPQVAARIAQRAGLTNSARAELDLQTKAFLSGASSHATIVGSYMEHGSGVTGKPRQVLAIGDYSDSAHAYVQTFVHTPQDSSREFRRLIDHLDLTGDGVDEIVLEGWRNGSDSYLVFLQYKDGRWREVARGPASWCADPAKG